MFLYLVIMALSLTLNLRALGFVSIFSVKAEQSILTGSFSQ